MNSSPESAEAIGFAPAAAAAVEVSVSKEPRDWRRLAESIVIPTGALLVAMVLFGGFCALAGARPIGVYEFDL